MSHGNPLHSSCRDSCIVVTSGVEKPPVEGLGEWSAPVFRKAPSASNIVSPRISPLSVELATGSQSGSLVFRSTQMISNCWSSVLNSNTEKPTLCRKMED